MPALSRFSIALKALRQLGFTQVALNALYRLGLRSGYFKRLKTIQPAANLPAPAPLFSLPARAELLAALGADGLRSLLAEADEVVAGKVRLFGAEPVELHLAPAGPLSHWADYETGKAPTPTPASTKYGFTDVPAPDIKFTWEPARFGWAFTLGRAYHAGGDEQYAAAFWCYFETFSAANPFPLGPNWMSGQEVGLRLMAFAWAAQVFAGSAHTTAERLAALAASIAAHAARIPPTMLYARSQNNNHLLSEAVALYTAALALPGHPAAAQWLLLGKNWINWCFENQIDLGGEYIQHSTNYQRLMLQLALWIAVVAKGQDPFLSNVAKERLARAVIWLALLVNPANGLAPNLGANDGAYILPLTTKPFSDFKPVIRALFRMFTDVDEARAEMELWFSPPRFKIDMDLNAPAEFKSLSYPGLEIPSGKVFFRIADIDSRPGHADQLHLDIWWRGLNIALDPGTYLYNAAHPWDNGLTATSVHNTVSVNHADQMPRVGRFLRLDWRPANVRKEVERIVHPLDGKEYGQVPWFTHAGYRSRFGVIHQRTFHYAEQTLVVRDLLKSAPNYPEEKTFTLHWLLPDWKWKFERQGSQAMFRLASLDGEIKLKVYTVERFVSGKKVPFPQERPLSMDVTIVRAGELVFGTGAVAPVRGWFSATYARKTPALSFAFEVRSTRNVEFVTEFVFPQNRMPRERQN